MIKDFRRLTTMCITAFVVSELANNQSHPDQDGLRSRLRKLVSLQKETFSNELDHMLEINLAANEVSLGASEKSHNEKVAEEILSELS